MQYFHLLHSTHLPVCPVAKTCSFPCFTANSGVSMVNKIHSAVALASSFSRLHRYWALQINDNVGDSKKCCYSSVCLEVTETQTLEQDCPEFSSQTLMRDCLESSQLQTVKQGREDADCNSSESLSRKDQIERLRRIKIGLANRGKVPWNKGRKHTAETRERIKQRTIEALRDPKVRKKMIEHRHSHSDHSKAKISSSLRKIWGERLKQKRLKEQFFLSWAKSIAEAAKKGGTDQQELDWDSYEILKKELARQQLQRAAEKAKEKARKVKEKEIRAEKAAQRKLEKLARRAEARRIREERERAREEMKRKACRKSVEDQKLKHRLTKIHKKKTLNIGASNHMTPVISQFPVWEKLDLELVKKDTMQNDISLADQIQAAKTKRTEYLFAVSSSSHPSKQA